jgi:glycine betaine/choline ABC-type transport system substrate-binding protein
MLNQATLAAGALSLSLLSGCGKPTRPIIVGSENSGDQILIGEIVAQHLEHRLHGKVERRLGLGGESILYQAILTGDVTLYPDYPAAVQANILKERPAADSAIAKERVRSEIRRITQLELLDPLGYENTPVFAVKEAGARKAKVRTLSETADSAFRWKLAMSRLPTAHRRTGRA